MKPLAERRPETDGLVDSPLSSPMLQPWEVFDQDLFDTEMLRVFSRSWIWLGDTEDLQRPGDYITGTIGSQPIVVVHTAAGEIKGYLNTELFSYFHAMQGGASIRPAACGEVSYSKSPVRTTYL